MISVHDANFQDVVIESKIPVLVLFERYGCGTAEIMKSILEKVASKYDGRVMVMKCNLDECSSIVRQYQIPDRLTVLLFRDGELKAEMGVLPKAEIEAILESVIGG